MGYGLCTLHVLSMMSLDSKVGCAYYVTHVEGWAGESESLRLEIEAEMLLIF